MKRAPKRAAPLLLLAAALTIAPPAAAGPGDLPSLVAVEADAGAKARAARLDELFARLKQPATKATDAADVVSEIWQLWLQSGNPGIDAHMVNAITLMQLGALDRALALLDDIVRLAPDYAEGWNKRATVLYMMEEYDRSLADIGRVLALEPRHFGAISGQGLIYFAKGEHARALVAFRKAAEHHPFVNEGNVLIPHLEALLGTKPI